jgi:hypothetical protein
MKPRSMLLAHLESFVEGIALALERLNPELLQSSLLKRIQARFEIDLNRSVRRLSSLRDSVKQLPDDASLEGAWANLEGIRRTTEPVLAECLAFIEGALTRAQGIDGGLCRLTDSMLYELSGRTDIGWNRFTLLAGGEFVTGISDIVRIHFPDVTIWSLPIAAHEFGHYVAANLKDPTLKSMIDRESRSSPQYGRHLNEFFSDLFAAYTMGPCFGLACLLARFSPASASQESPTHPTLAHRMWWIVEALRTIEKLRAGPPLYQYITDQLEQSWRASVGAAGGTAEIGDQDARRLRRWLAEVLEAVDANLSGALYRGWLRAQELAEPLRRKQMPSLTPNDRIPDVLNAAWLCRSELDAGDSYQVTWLADNAFKLCGELVNDSD